MVFRMDQDKKKDNPSFRIPPVVGRPINFTDLIIVLFGFNLFIFLIFLLFA